MTLETCHYDDGRKHGNSCDMCHYHPFHQSFIYSQIVYVIVIRNYGTFIMTADEGLLSVGILFFTMAFCKVLIVPAYKGKAVQPNLERLCLLLFVQAAIRLLVVIASVIKSTRAFHLGNLARARYERSSFLGNPIRYDKAWIHILENMAKMSYVILYSFQQGQTMSILFL